MAKQIKGARLSEAERKARWNATRERHASKQPKTPIREKGASFFYDTHDEPLKPCKGARANVSLTLSEKGRMWMYRLPVDTTDREHIEQGTKLVTAALAA